MYLKMTKKLSSSLQCYFNLHCIMTRTIWTLQVHVTPQQLQDFQVLIDCYKYPFRLVKHWTLTLKRVNFQLQS